MRRAVLVSFVIASVVSGLGALLVKLPAPDAAGRIDEEIGQLERRLEQLDPASLPKELAPYFGDARKAIAEVGAAGTPQLRIYRLRDAFVSVTTLEFFAEHASVKDLGVIRSLAEERRDSFETPLPPARGAALQLALREASANRAEKLFQAALPYAEASSPSAGIYYLGEAEGNRGFADLVMTLPFAAEPDARPTLPAIDAALGRLDTELLALFGSDPSGRSAIGPSARLKEARELAARGSVNGAALLLLEARHLISTRQKERSEATASKAPPRSDSITALWHAQKSAAADVVERDVLPLYASLFIETAGTPRKPAMVTVTLVRWPYT